MLASVGEAPHSELLPAVTEVCEAFREFCSASKIEEKEEAKRIFGEALQKCSETYQRLIELGIPKEDARYIMPNATKTNIIVTMNARSLINFFSLRLEKDAQWEIRALAKKMLEEVNAIAPAIFREVYEKYAEH